MDVKQLVQDEDAVSPVIGVILMVAITVILAAVIGTFVLGLGDQVQSSAPNANFQFEYGSIQYTDGTETATLTTVTVQHNGGQDVDPSNVGLEVAGNPAYGVEDTGGGPEADSATVPYSGISTISTGTSAQLAFVDTDGPDNTNDYTSGTDPTLDTSSNLENDAAPISGGETVRVIWTSPNGDSSNTIGTSTVPN